MKVDEMLRQAKGVLDSIHELAARLSAVEREFKDANNALDDTCQQIAHALRIMYPMEDALAELPGIIATREARRRELETGIRLAISTLTDPRFPDTAIAEACIQLTRLIEPSP